MNYQNNQQQPYQNPIVDDESIQTQATSFKELAMRQIQCCLTACSKAMTPGSVRSVMVDGKVKEVITPDTIDEFCNSVKALEILLSPKLELKGGEIKKYLDEYSKANKKLADFEQKMFAELREDSFNDEMKKSGQYAEKTKFVERHIEQSKVDIHMKLFRALNQLAASLNYFDEASI